MVRQDKKIRSVLTDQDIQSTIKRCRPDLAEAFSGATFSGRVLHSGDFLEEPGDSDERIHIVASGCLKQSTIDRAGDTHIGDFFFEGDVIGFDAPSVSGVWSEVTAYDTAFVVSAPINSLLNVADCGLPKTLLHASRQALARSKEASFIVTTKTASVRLAWFLEHLRQRVQSQPSTGLSEIELPMPRADIAHYLGLASETISRELSSMSRRKIIRVDNRTIRILDLTALRQLADVEDSDGLAA